MTSLVALQPVPPPTAKAEDFDAAFAEFLRLDVANGDASPDTISSYRTQVAAWVAWCQSRGINPATATTADIKGYRQALLEAGYKPVSIRWMLTIIRRFYQAAVNAGLRFDNPAAGVKAPRVRRAMEDFKYLSNEQLDQLLAVVPDFKQASGQEKVKQLRNRLMLTLMALHALRTVEIHRANAEDLTERAPHLVLMVRGKMRDRLVYLRPDTAESLRTYLELRGRVKADESGTPLFAALGNRHGGYRLSRRHIRSRTDTYLEEAGLKRPGISNHALRHYAGCRTIPGEVASGPAGGSLTLVFPA